MSFRVWWGAGADSPDRLLVIAIDEPLISLPAVGYSQRSLSAICFRDNRRMKLLFLLGERLTTALLQQERKIQVVELVG